MPEERLAALPGREDGDIAIAPLEVRFDGELSGLVIEEEDEPGDEEDGEEAEGAEEYRFTAELHPDGLGFHAPWCGCYDT
ncbi:hypothetical protein ACIRD3_25130 [Kitasatospora sp. NPDC093550]|uniref:hypothetical protein n=1 Tax=Kitasatospora sp. NPDC093550 TaxID=3364089 RepID=UPI003801CF62